MSILFKYISIVKLYVCVCRPIYRLSFLRGIPTYIYEYIYISHTPHTSKKTTRKIE